MTGHTIYRGTARERDLWDRNPRCRCEHTWRSHWTRRAGGRCDVMGCLCQAWTAPPAGEEDAGSE